MGIGNLLRKAGKKAIEASITPPLMISEVAIVGSLLVGFGAMALHKSLETKDGTGETLTQKAIVAAVTPPLLVVEVVAVGSFILGCGGMVLHKSLETEEEREAEMARRREFIAKAKADRYYRAF